MKYDNFNRKHFDCMADKDIINYHKFLKDRMEKDNSRMYVLSAAVDNFSVYDCEQLSFPIEDPSDKTRVYLELKGRDCAFKQFDCSMTDLNKWQSLARLSQIMEQDVYFVNLFYKSGHIAMWKVDTEKEYETFVKEVPKRTVIDKNDKQQKVMVKLPWEDALVYSFVPAEL